MVVIIFLTAMCMLIIFIIKSLGTLEKTCHQVYFMEASSFCVLYAVVLDEEDWFGSPTPLIQTGPDVI